ncbi:hypothetical protein ARGLB_037_00030 [Arthrobacter globiformis NBRC 12137]|uniref:Uncharacterized protein n=1 Tax=Arthrobacter globiformis (strain ATCC 8010 / DSM 20124 / JCM 1332 / NBRC 12137 / NCIMB 8907 / NRRL B-2979 / 168) TaxID=1077972 RepID=H0QKF6_ARTG1|nr:hypothetical protein [Arthrobacter globiformis]GAB13155.1 hypothetical protein ARGLB_037_00030 [Arthrobacter globiformis NBRC 12137]
MTSPVNPAESDVPAPSAELWKPALLRAAAALAFGAVTVFWAAPSVAGMSLTGGVYLLATGLILLWGIPMTGFRREAPAGRLLSAAGAALTGAGVALLFLQGSLVFAVIGAVGLAVASAAELWLGVTLRGRHVLARDWLASGVIGLGTAGTLPFFVGLGPHALLGVAGGGAIISGVLWILAGLSLRHDARADAPKAVN